MSHQKSHFLHMICKPWGGGEFKHVQRYKLMKVKLRFMKHKSGNLKEISCDKLVLQNF